MLFRTLDGLMFPHDVTNHYFLGHMVVVKLGRDRSRFLVITRSTDSVASAISGCDSPQIIKDNRGTAVFQPQAESDEFDCDPRGCTPIRTTQFVSARLPAEEEEEEEKKSVKTLADVYLR